MDGGRGRRFFISYVHGAVEDERLRTRLAEALTVAGHEVFFDEKVTFGSDWAGEIERQLRECDYFLLLLSEKALASEMVMQELERVRERRRSTGSPGILTVRMKLEGTLPYRWGAYLDGYQWKVWRGEADFEPILQAILGAAGDQAPAVRHPPRRPWVSGAVAVAVAALGVLALIRVTNAPAPEPLPPTAPFLPPPDARPAPEPAHSGAPPATPKRSPARSTEEALELVERRCLGTGDMGSCLQVCRRGGRCFEDARAIEETGRHLAVVEEMMKLACERTSTPCLYLASKLRCGGNGWRADPQKARSYLGKACARGSSDRACTELVPCPQR